MGFDEMPRGSGREGTGLAPLTPAEVRERVDASRGASAIAVWRDLEGCQHVCPLSDAAGRVVVGRGEETDVSLPFDRQVSRVHAELVRIGSDWFVADDGLSRNGTYVNGARVRTRRRLRDGDIVRVGGTPIAFLTAPGHGQHSMTVDATRQDPADFTDAQISVLIALARPFKGGNMWATPATNREIADELFLSVDSVKRQLRTLSARLHLPDLPQNAKRSELVRRAFDLGLIRDGDL